MTSDAVRTTLTKARLTDADTLRELHALMKRMSADELERFCEGQMQAIVVAQDVFRKRFPARWQRFNDKIENETSGCAVTDL